MYECKEHGIAYQHFAQFKGHWINKHPGQPVPSEETVKVEALSPGVTLAPAPAEQPWAVKLSPKRRQPKEEQPVPLADRTDDQPGYQEDQEDEDARRLKGSLIGIGVPDQEVQGIVRGWQRFSMVRGHPMNLSNYIVSYINRLPPVLVKAITNLVPMVIEEMFPQQPQPQTSPYYSPSGYAAPGYAPYYSPSGYTAPGYAPAPVHTQAYPYYPPNPSYPYPVPGADPMSKRLEELEARLAEEREERRRERQEAHEKERARAVEERFADIARVGEERYAAIVQLIQKNQEERGDNQGSALTQKVDQLAAQLGDERQKSFEHSIANLAATQKDQSTALVAISRYLTEGGGQSGKSLEDLLAQLGPTLLDKVEKAGDRMVGEMKGFREGAMRGGLPGTIASQSQADTRTASALAGAATSPASPTATSMGGPPRQAVPSGPRTQEALRVAQLAQAETKVIEAAATKQ